MVWQYVAAAQGQAQGQTGIEIYRLTFYDVSRAQAKQLGRARTEEDGWLKVIAEDVWMIPDQRGEDMGR